MEAAPGRPRDDDEELVARFQRGDESAFDVLVDRHRRPVYRLAYRLTGRHEEADDLAQEAFLRAYRALGRFRGEARFGTWLTRIVVNLAQNSRRARRPAVPLEAAESIAAAGGGPDAALLVQVKRAVGRLPPRQRQVLVLKAFEGFKFVEIAALAGISIGTAKATFSHAVRNLRHRLGAAGARRERGGERER